MSSIPYPHVAEVWRTIDADALPGNLDAWGNPAFEAGDTTLVEEMECWIQVKPVQQQIRIASLSDQEDMVSTLTVFCDPRTFHPTDFLITVAGGGQPGGERLRILQVNNPDGGTDHLELDCVKVARGGIL